MAAKSGAAASMRKIAARAEKFPKTFVKASVADLRKAVTKTLKADTGGDRVLSRAARKSRGHRPTALKVKKSIKGGDSLVTGEVAAGAPRAQWFWLEEGTKPHRLGSRRVESGAMHPGTKPGKKTWSRAITPQLRRAQRSATRELRIMVQGR